MHLKFAGIGPEYDWATPREPDEKGRSTAITAPCITESSATKVIPRPVGSASSYKHQHNKIYSLDTLQKSTFTVSFRIVVPARRFRVR